MTHHPDAVAPPAFDLAALDADGALAGTWEAARDTGLTRGGALRAAMAGLVGGSVLLGAEPALAAPKRSRRQDVAILQYALAAEYLGATFYREALAHKQLSGLTLEYATKARADEVEHVAAVKAQIRRLGGTPAPAPTFDFGNTTRNLFIFQRTAAAIEEVCVETLNGAGPLVTKDTLAAAGKLVSVEARQVTWIRLIINATSNPVPLSFDPALTLRQSARKVRSTGFIIDRAHRAVLNSLAAS